MVYLLFYFWLTVSNALAKQPRENVTIKANAKKMGMFGAVTGHHRVPVTVKISDIQLLTP